jgi:hypothetical protein
MAWLCLCRNTPDDDPKESRAIVARAHKRTWARMGLKSGVHMHIVGDDRPVGPHRGQCAVKLETQIALCVNAVVDKEVDLVEVGEQPW